MIKTENIFFSAFSFSLKRWSFFFFFFPSPSLNVLISQRSGNWNPGNVSGLLLDLILWESLKDTFWMLLCVLQVNTPDTVINIYIYIILSQPLSERSDSKLIFLLRKVLYYSLEDPSLKSKVTHGWHAPAWNKLPWLYFLVESSVRLQRMGTTASYYSGLLVQRLIGRSRLSLPNCFLGWHSHSSAVAMAKLRAGVQR